MLTPEQRAEINEAVKRLEEAEKLIPKKRVARPKETPKSDPILKYDFDDNIWELRPSVLKVARTIKKYCYHEGTGSTTRHVKIWINPEDCDLFTSFVHNSIVKAISTYYGGIVLLEYRYTAFKKDYVAKPLIEMDEDDLPF